HERASAKASEIQSVELTKMVKYAKKFAPVLDKLDPDTRRKLLLLKFQAQPAPDDPNSAAELAKIMTEMDSLYGKGVCTTPTECKDIEYWAQQLQTERDPKKLLATWKTWHDAVGHVERDRFARFVELANEGARGIGFSDVSVMWKSGYDMPPEDFATRV